MAKQKYTVEIDPEAMRIGDLEVIDNLTANATGSIAPFFEMLDRVATFEGVDDFRDLPLGALKDIAGAIGSAVGDASEEGN
jgi:hypothetical protein